MHLVKWTRKNMQKIMVFVIIFCMVSFVIGSVGLKWVVSLFGGGNQMIAYYDDGQKIKAPDFRRAHSELTILQMLMADRFLMAQSSSGVSGPLLIHLLFPESQFASLVPTQMKQAVQQGQLPISQEDLNNYFQQRPESPEILWLLLKNEAYQAGSIISTDKAAQMLRYIIPQMTNNQIDAAGLVNQIIANNNASEQQVLRVFSDLMSIIAYADKVMNNEAVTINQVKASVGRTKERIDVEYVNIESKPLIDEDTDISDSLIQEQFNKYKAIAPNNPTDDNPFGFGYKLGKRIQLEYMVVLMDDVNKQIEKPTPEAIEEYYSQNITRFQTQEPTDPNNPDSEKITKTQSFAEVESQIRQMLESEKALTQANVIFNDIKDKTESGFETLNNFEEASVAELQKAAGDYVVVGQELSKKYSVPIISGKTGWLDTNAFAADKVLTNMGVLRGRSYIRLSELAFTVTEDNKRQYHIGIPSVRLWENLGPLNSGYYSEKDQKFYRLMALVRVVGIKEATVPENINIAFDTKGIMIGDQPADNTSFSLVDQVKDDLRVMAGMDIAKARAEEFVSLVNNQDWPQAIESYNNKYAENEEDTDDSTDSQKVIMRGFKARLRISAAEVNRFKKMMRANPGSAQYLQQRITDNILTNRFYSLLPEDAATTGTIQAIVPFEPEQTYYVVKEVVRQPASLSDYLDNKAQTALQLDAEQSAELSLIHFGPENVLKRSGYKPVNQQKQNDESEQEATPVDDKED